MAGDAYDLDGSKSKVQMLRQMFDLKLEIATLKDLLDRHGIISSLEFDSAKKYKASTSEFKQMSDYLDQVESQINHYKSDPQAYLRDLMNAKMNGTIR